MKSVEGGQGTDREKKRERESERYSHLVHG